MKVANISVLNQTPSDYFMIENIDDIIEYQEMLNGELEESFHKIMTSSVEPRKWNHLLNENSQGDTTIAHSIIKCEAEGGNPLLKAPALAQQKIDRIKQHISNGETVIVNVNNLALKDEAFLAFRPHWIKRKRLLLSKRLWIDAMREVYDSLTGFLKRVVIPLLKDALTF